MLHDMDTRDAAELQALFARCLVHWQRCHSVEWYGGRQFTIVKPRTRPARPRAELTRREDGSLEARAEFELVIRRGELRKNFDDDGYGLGFSESRAGDLHRGTAQLLLAAESIRAVAPSAPLTPIRGCFTGVFEGGQLRWTLLGIKAGPADESCESPREDQFAQRPMPVASRFAWLLAAQPFAYFEINCPPVVLCQSNLSHASGALRAPEA
jgi:hypothetical protein